MAYPAPEIVLWVKLGDYVVNVETTFYAILLPPTFKIFPEQVTKGVKACFLEFFGILPS